MGRSNYAGKYRSQVGRGPGKWWEHIPTTTVNSAAPFLPLPLSHTTIQVPNLVRAHTPISQELIDCFLFWLNFKLTVQNWITFHLKSHMSCQESHCIQLIPNSNSFHTAQVSSKTEPRSSVCQSRIFTISHLLQYKVPTLSLAPTLDSNCVSNLISFNFTTCSSAEGNFLHTPFLSHPSVSSGNLCALVPQSWWLFWAFIPNEEHIIPNGKNILWK